MDSNQPVIIYISAAVELMAEREALARMIAELPVSLPWHIAQTPIGAEPPDLEALANANLYVLAIGADIRAPLGLELHIAEQANRTIKGFTKQGLIHTPAGRAFIQNNRYRIQWQPFTDAAHLSRRLRTIIIEYLLLHAIRFALTPAELSELKKLLSEQTSPQENPEQGDVGHSAHILSRERFRPSGGVIIDEP